MILSMRNRGAGALLFLLRGIIIMMLARLSLSTLLAKHPWTHHARTRRV